MAEFKRLSLSNFEPQQGVTENPESLYWKSFSFPVTIQETAAITSINFSPVDHRQFASTCSTKVQIYNTATSQVHRVFTKFKTEAYGGIFRDDGKLIACGGDEGRIRIFDVETRSMLRVLNGHKGPVHKCNFTTDSVRLVSFSDDKNVVLWDVPGETPVTVYSEHNDYVRAGATSSACKDVFVSGSYDHSVKLYDSRTKKCVLTIDHGSPVESVLMFPNGNAIVSSGGQEIRIWDFIGGGKLIAKLSQHHKTITCLSLSTNGKRLLSGSLDKHVKIYDTIMYNVVRTLDCPSPILSIGISAGDQALAIGMTDGTLSIQSRQQNISKRRKSTSKRKLKDVVLRDTDNVMIVKPEEVPKLRKYDDMLRKYEVSKALEVVIKENLHNEPHVVIAVIHELIRRGALKAAMAAKPHQQVADMISFILLHISNPNYSRVLLDFTEMLFDIYGANLAKLHPRLVRRLQQTVSRELETMKEMMKLKGTIELLKATSNVNKSQSVVLNGGDNLSPTEK